MAPSGGFNRACIGGQRGSRAGRSTRICSAAVRRRRKCGCRPGRKNTVVPFPRAGPCEPRGRRCRMAGAMTDTTPPDDAAELSTNSARSSHPGFPCRRAVITTTSMARWTTSSRWRSHDGWTAASAPGVPYGHSFNTVDDEPSGKITPTIEMLLLRREAHPIAVRATCGGAQRRLGNSGRPVRAPIRAPTERSSGGPGHADVSRERS